MSKGIRRGENIAFILLVIGSVVLFNMLSARTFARLDLTSDQFYTISEASKKMLRNLPDRLTIKVFVSKQLPPWMQTHANFLRDMVLDYAAASRGRVTAEVVVIDEKDKKAQAEARRFKVKSLKLSQSSKSRKSLQLVYFGIAMQYGGKIEPVRLQALNDLEYQLSSTVRRLTLTKKVKVGIASGHGELSAARGLVTLNRFLGQYDVVNVDLREGKKPIANDVSVLLIVGPKSRFSDRALYEIDRFLMRGGAVALFLDGMRLETPRGNFRGHIPPRIGRSNVTGLEPMLAHYGVKLNANLVLDRSHQPVPVPIGDGRAALVSYPGYPLVRDISKKHVITKTLRPFQLHFPSSLELLDVATNKGSGIETHVLAKSSSASWAHQGFFLFNPRHRPKPSKVVGPFNLAIYMKGTFASYFSGRPVPKPGPPVARREKPPTPTRAQKAKPGARIVVISDSEFISDQGLHMNMFRRPNMSSLALVGNVIDYLAQDEALISIRAKRQTRRPLEQVEDSKQTALSWGSVLGVPVVFVVLGLFALRLRTSARQRRAEEILAGRLIASGLAGKDDCASDSGSDDTDSSTSEDSEDSEDSDEDSEDERCEESDKDGETVRKDGE